MTKQLPVIDMEEGVPSEAFRRLQAQHREHLQRNSDEIAMNHRDRQMAGFEMPNGWF